MLAPNLIIFEIINVSFNLSQVNHELHLKNYDVSNLFA